MAAWRSPSGCWVLGEQQAGTVGRAIAAGQREADRQAPAPRAAVPNPGCCRHESSAWSCKAALIHC